MKHKGIFVTLEGIEGCGKSTQVALLEKNLKMRGYSVYTTREPGGTTIGNLIRSILLDSNNMGMNQTTELLLYEACRAELTSKVIAPRLSSGEIVLCDRYTDSTIAYQGYARGLDMDLIKKLNIIAEYGQRPDLTILLDLDPKTGLQRARARNKATALINEERFELESLQFHEKVRNGFLAIAKNEPQRVKTVFATGTVEEIARDIMTTIDSSALFNFEI
jgi:dTMP kinase